MRAICRNTILVVSRKLFLSLRKISIKSISEEISQGRNVIIILLHEKKFCFG